MTPPLELEVVRRPEELIALAPAWRQLESVACRTSFQTFAWNRAWWELVGAPTGGHALHIVCLRREGRLSGLAPFVIEETNDGRRLAFLGDPWNDYNDILLAPGPEFAGPGVALIAEHLRDGLGREWDRIDLSGVPAWSPLVTAAGGHGVLLRADEVVQRCSMRSLERDSSGPSKNNRHKIRHLAAQGELSLRLLTEPHDLRAAMPNFMTMHIQQWAGRPEAVAPFLDPEVMRFFANSVDTLASASLVGLFELALGGRPVSYDYGFTHHSSFLSYRPTYAQDLAHLSPGTVLLSLAFTHLWRLGFSTFDFGRGDYSYKDQFADHGVDGMRITLASS